jgi:hypothetical protein
MDTELTSYVTWTMLLCSPGDVKRDPTLIEQLIYVCAGNVGAQHAVFEQGASAGNVGNEKLVQGRTANPTDCCCLQL